MRSACPARPCARALRTTPRTPTLSACAPRASADCARTHALLQWRGTQIETACAAADAQAVLREYWRTGGSPSRRTTSTQEYQESTAGQPTTNTTARRGAARMRWVGKSGGTRARLRCQQLRSLVWLGYEFRIGALFFLVQLQPTRACMHPCMDTCGVRKGAHTTCVHAPQTHNARARECIFSGVARQSSWHSKDEGHSGREARIPKARRRRQHAAATRPAQGFFLTPWRWSGRSSARA